MRGVLLLHVLRYVVEEVLVVLCSPAALSASAAAGALALLLLLLVCSTNILSISWLPHIHKHLILTNYRNALCILLISSSSSLIA